MDQLPDLEAISILLSVVEGRDPATTTVSRFDEDHNVLRNTQAELVDTLTRDSPEGDDKEHLRRVLQRLEDTIELNRSLRKDAMTREIADQP